MATKTYKLYLNYDNDSKVYVIPVLPEELQCTYKGETTSSTIDSFGEVLHKGKRDAAIIKWSSFFPAQYVESLCACKKSEFKKPTKWHAWMKKLEEAKKPCHLVLTNAPFNLNIYADVISYVGKEVGGDPGTIEYTVELKEHRDPTIRTVKIGSKTNSSSNSGSRTDNREDTNKFTVTASALHLRTGPNQTIIGLMPHGSTITTDGKTNGNWVHVLYNGKWGWAYKSYLKSA